MMFASAHDDRLETLIVEVEARPRLLNDPDFIDRLDIAMTIALDAGAAKAVGRAERRLCEVEARLLWVA